MTKIALIGSAPHSILLAPYGDPSHEIWACSPGTYPVIPRCDAFFELHRWQPPVIGKADKQVPWFSPEYCMWMAQQKLVWMAEAVPEIPNSRRLPAEQLVNKYGTYNFTSSLAWMFAMAIEKILDARAEANGQTDFVAPEPDSIGLWGVDMSAISEYGYQRAGCQFFANIADQLGIKVVVPPESDLLMPPPLYGIAESHPMSIKLLARKNDLENRLNQAKAQSDQMSRLVSFLEGALDDTTYMMGTWIQLDMPMGARLAEIYGPKDKSISE